MRYNSIWLSQYTDAFVEKQGGMANNKECDIITKFLQINGYPNWTPIIINDHTPYSDSYFGNECGYNTEIESNMVSYYEKKLYGCCIAWSLPYKGIGIPLTQDWRDNLKDIKLPCKQCFLSK